MVSNIYLNELNISQGFNITNSPSPNGNNVGFSVSNIGDINGDSYDDIIVNSQYEAGYSYVIFGNSTSTFAQNIDLKTITEKAQGFLIVGCTFVVSGAGDMNGDGYADIIIGGPLSTDPNHGPYHWYVYVIFGASVFAGTIKLVNEGFKIGESYGPQYGFGYSLSNAGDVNGDGYDDVVIGYPGSYNEYGNGSSYIIFGNEKEVLLNRPIDINNLTPDQGFIIIGNGGGNGYSVSGAGDINDDEYDDVIIGAYTGKYNDKTYGISYIIFGSNMSTTVYLNYLEANTTQGFLIVGAISGGGSGISVSGVGDINEDTIDDIMIGSYDRIDNPDGVSYVVYGSRAPFSTIQLNEGQFTSKQGFSIFGPHLSQASGYSVNKAGDVNGDGIGDMIIGAPKANGVGNATGNSYIVFGKTGTRLDITLEDFPSVDNPGYVVFGAINSYCSGLPVSEAGDINRDGYSDIIIGAAGAWNAWASSNQGAAYVIFGGASSPTSVPTPRPTTSPTHPTSAPVPAASWLDSIGFKVSFGLGMSAVAMAAGWCFREKIAFYVLNNWGYKFKLLSNEDSLQAKEIGIRFLPGSNELFAQINNREIKLIVGDRSNVGISSVLHATLCSEFNQQLSTSFTFLPSEEIQLRDFLFAQEFIKFKDLGYIRGSLYRMCLMKYKTLHKEKHENNVRSTVKAFYTPTTITLVNSEDDDTHSPLLAADIGEVRDIPVATNVNTAYIVGNTRAGLLCIDALMDPEYAKLQGKAFAEFSQHLMLAYKDLSSVFIYEQNKAQILLDDSYTKTDALMIHQKLASTNSEPFSSSDNLMISLFAANQLIEYLPIIKYTTQSTLNYLGYNITLPDILGYTAILISTHLILGNSAAQLLPAESIINGMIVTTISSGSYAMKLVAADYLKNHEVADNPIDLAKQCGTTIVAYTLPSIATCLLTKLVSPEMPCAITGMDILASGSLGAMQCYSNYKVVAQSPEPTAADVVVPYIADAIAVYTLSGYFGIDTSNPTALMMCIKNSMSALAAVVAADSMSRMVMDVVPEEVKTVYIDPVLDCIGDLYSCFA